MKRINKIIFNFLLPITIIILFILLLSCKKTDIISFLKLARESETSNSSSVSTEKNIIETVITTKEANITLATSSNLDTKSGTTILMTKETTSNTETKIVSKEDKKEEINILINVLSDTLNLLSKSGKINILSKSEKVYQYNYEIYNDDGIIIDFGDPADYSDIEGITCFRGNNFRDAPSYGTVDVKENRLEAIWQFNIGYLGKWTGVGWNGQPSIVKWNPYVKSIMNIYEEKKNKKDLKEVIYATLDGNIYFFDLDDGKPTRDSINVGYPHKGSVAIDPRGYPLLYAGQGINLEGQDSGTMGYRIFSLINSEQLFFIDGLESLAYRKWGAFDSNPLIDKENDSMILSGENGIIYKIRLNTNFDIENEKISLSPDITKYRYNSTMTSLIGIEGSPVAYNNNIYFADNGGLFHSLTLDKLEPNWILDVNDDTDSTSVLELENGIPMLYTATEMDIQKDGGYSYIRKINSQNGEFIWENKFKCYYDSRVNGGALSSPVLGKNDIENLVIFSISKTKGNEEADRTKGILVAYDKETGSEVWRNNLSFYAWSSPVDIYTSTGKSYIILGDSGGYMNLIDGKTGILLNRIFLEANIEGSPAIYDDIAVVGTRGQKIWGIKIK